jgi:uncharacterized protein
MTRMPAAKDRLKPGLLARFQSGRSAGFEASRALCFCQVRRKLPSGMNEWVLVTGASSGIGHELAKLFAADKFNLLLVARNETRLATVAGELSSTYSVQAIPIARDLAHPSSANEIFAATDDRTVTILVNNAGFGQYGEFLDSDLKTEVEMMQVNMTSLVELTHLFAKPMRQRNSGKILNVASVAAFQPGPTVAIYYASKAFVYSFSYALSDELAGTGVTVTTLCPGTTRTEFFQRAGIHLHRPWPLADPAAVARAGYKAMMRGKRVVVPGMTNRFFSIVSPCLPSRVTAAIVRKIHARRSA